MDAELPDAGASLSWGDILALPMPLAGERLAYGDDPNQIGEWLMPESPDQPSAVVVLLHGGCWLEQFDRGYFRHLAAWYAQQGYAVWNLEYRRIGQPGGGWPGTFEDVADGIDFLRVLAQNYPLDLSRVMVLGHSAGGHLALWAASRQQLPASSPLYRADPLPLMGILGTAAIADLAAYRVGPAGSCNAAVDALIGGTAAQQPQRYAQTSPAQRLPLGVRQALLAGENDSIVPAAGVTVYAQQAQAAGDAVRVQVLPTAGHFDLAVPTQQNAAILRRFTRWLLGDTN